MAGKPTYEELERRVIKLAQEVQKRERIEEALWESEARYKGIFDYTQSGVAVYQAINDGEDFVFVDFNKAAERIENIKKSDLIGKSVLEIFPGVKDFGLFDVFQRVLKTGEPEHHSVALYKDTRISGWRDNYVYKLASGEVVAVYSDETERRRTEGALQESEQKFRALFDQSFQFIGLLKTDGTLIEANKAALKFAEVELKDVLGKPFWETIWWSHSAELQNRLKAAIHKAADGELVRFEAFHPAVDGHIHYLDVSIKPVKDEAGNVVFLIPEGRDITERKQGEGALQASESMLKSIFRAAPTGIGVVSKRVITKANERLCDMLGYSNQELIGQSAKMLYPTDEEFDYVGQEKYAQIQSQGTGTVETRWQRKDGQIIDVLLSSTPLDTNDLSVGVTFTALDITRRKQTEEALRESEEKYRDLVENINDVIYATDENGHLIYISPVIEHTSDYSQEELIGRSFAEFIHPEDLARVMKNFEKVASGKIAPGEYRIIAKSGGVRWVRSSSRPIYEKDRFVGLRGMITDITEQKRLEARLFHALKMEAIGTLAGGIAHDFNNILSGIIGYTELSLDDVEKGTLLHSNLMAVLSAGSRAKDLVQQILTFSRQTEYELKPVQIKTIVKEVLKFLRASLPTSIQIHRELQSDALILGDPTQIHQVLMNLCTNASHAMQEKGGTLEVRLMDEEFDFSPKHYDLKPGKYIKLTVSDTGQGMTADVLGKIFDPFFTTKEKGEGTGMGLSVVHGILESHGGRIYASSELGKGAAFNAYFPAIERAIEPEIEIEETLPTGTEHILFVDDEQVLLNIGKRTLETLGYDVTTRTNAVEALELFKARPDKFDMVITDLTMPNMTGDDLAKEILQIRPDIPVILCTGFSERIDEQKAMAMGLRAYISKPISQREMAWTIRAVLDG